MATLAKELGDEIVCEKCRKRKAKRECLLAGASVIYLCEECARLVAPFMAFLGPRDK